jgi:lipopolysaccharide export system permease protein
MARVTIEFPPDLGVCGSLSLRRLDKYVVTSTLKLLVLCECAGVVLFTLIDFLEHLDLFTKDFEMFLLGASYLALKIPLYFNLILPLCLLISILIVIIVMIRGNEIIIIRTAGISTFSLMKPLILLSFFLVLFSFALSEWIIPITSSTGEYVYQVKIKKEQTYVVYKNDKIWFKRDNQVCNIEFFDARKDEIRGLTVLYMSKNWAVTKRYDAVRGIWKDGSWIFYDVTERSFKNEGIESKTTHESLNGLIKEPPSVFKIANKSPEDMSYEELQRYIGRLRRNGHDVRRYMVDLYDKLSFPFINIIMVLVGFSVGLRYSKTKNIAKGVFFGICIGILYWLVRSVAMPLGYSEIFPPLFAAWFSNMLFFSFGVIGIVTVRT